MVVKIEIVTSNVSKNGSRYKLNIRKVCFDFNIKMQSGSLVKYNTPILVSTTGAGKKNQKKSASEKQTTQTEDILNSILPPRFVSCVE